MIVHSYHTNFESFSHVYSIHATGNLDLDGYTHLNILNLSTLLIFVFGIAEDDLIL